MCRQNGCYDDRHLVQIVKISKGGEITSKFAKEMKSFLNSSTIVLVVKEHPTGTKINLHSADRITYKQTHGHGLLRNIPI